MIVISHDRKFLQNIGIEKMIYSPFRDGVGNELLNMNFPKGDKFEL